MFRTCLIGAALSLALAPLALADKFCDGVKKIVAASNEQPRPFMSLLKGEFGEVTGLGWTKLTLPGFSQCTIVMGWLSQSAGRPWKYHCDAPKGSKLRMEKLATDVRACLGVEEVFREDIDIELGMPGQAYTLGEHPAYGTPLILIMDKTENQSYATIDFQVFRKVRE